MKVITLLAPNVTFSQGENLVKPQTTRIKSLNEKFHIRGNEAWKDRGLDGLCLGLSIMYMCQVAQGGFDKGEQFLKSLEVLANKPTEDKVYIEIFIIK